MLMFRLKRSIKLGIKSLWMHRLRSALTVLGIIFGVCSVIAMLAIGEGASLQAQEDIKRLGSTNIIIETVKPPEEEADSGSTETVLSYGLTYADAESIRNTLTDADVIVPVRIIDQEARYRRQKTAVKVKGTVPWYTEIFPTQILRGRFLSSTDLHRQLSVCVIEDALANKLFRFDDPLGKDLNILGNYYRVIGITAASGGGKNSIVSSAKSANTDTGNSGVIGTVYIPVTTAKSRFGELSFQFGSAGRGGSKVELQKIIVKVKTNEMVLTTRKALDGLLGRLHDKKDFQIIVPLLLLRQAERTQRIFSIVLGSIAIISLLVGGIGIMNIMLATVSERTREIGIRRALGARKRDIIMQFLSETLLLTLIGGILGIILGSIIPFMVTRFGDMPTVITSWSLILSFGISAAIGITFGMYPACHAANMDPIESLRHE